MTLGLDTDILIHWALANSPRHSSVRRLFREQVDRGGRLGLTRQVLWEFMHVISDPRRFETPMPLDKAGLLATSLWDSPEVEAIQPGPGVVSRTVSLLKDFRLGRKRILDTALAATLESAGVRRLATLNAGDYACFTFLVVVAPDHDEGTPGLASN